MLPLPIVLLSLVLPALVLGGARDRGVDGDFDQRRSIHFRLLQDVDIDRVTGPQGTRAFERAVLEELERAYERVRRTFDLRPRQDVRVVIYDPKVFEETFKDRFRFSSAGFYDGYTQLIHVRGDTTVDENLLTTLHHEYFHAALDAVAPRGRVPAWLNEGLAQWFEVVSIGAHGLGDQARGMLASASRSGRWLPLDKLSGPTLANLSGNEEARLGYLQSYAMAEYLMRNEGERKVHTFLRQLVRNGGLERQMERAFRYGPSELEERLRRELR